MSLKIIVCKSSNDVIGINNSIPWNLPEDLIYFKEQTKNSVVVMGRNTWESLPNRPLPDRINVIISNNPSRYFLNDAEYDDPSIKHIFQLDNDDAFAEKIQELEKEYGDVWIIGGQKVYELALDVLDFDEIHVTNILREILPENESDEVAYFPMEKVLAKYIPEEEHAEVFTSVHLPDRERYTITRYLPK